MPQNQLQPPARTSQQSDILNEGQIEASHSAASIIAEPEASGSAQSASSKAEQELPESSTALMQLNQEYRDNYMRQTEKLMAEMKLTPEERDEER